MTDPGSPLAGYFVALDGHVWKILAAENGGYLLKRPAGRPLQDKRLFVFPDKLEGAPLHPSAAVLEHTEQTRGGLIYCAAYDLRDAA